MLHCIVVDVTLMYHIYLEKISRLSTKPSCFLTLCFRINCPELKFLCSNVRDLCKSAWSLQVCGGKSHCMKLTSSLYSRILQLSFVICCVDSFCPSKGDVTEGLISSTPCIVSITWICAESILSMVLMGLKKCLNRAVVGSLPNFAILYHCSFAN